jgi:hypothetical protein
MVMEKTHAASFLARDFPFEEPQFLLKRGSGEWG